MTLKTRQVYPWSESTTVKPCLWRRLSIVDPPLFLMADVGALGPLSQAKGKTKQRRPSIKRFKELTTVYWNTEEAKI